MAARTLTQYLLDVGGYDNDRNQNFTHILSAVAVSVKLTAAMISRGQLVLDLDSSSAPPAARDLNRALRRLATRNLLTQAEDIAQLAAVSVSGSSSIHCVSPSGRYLLLFEALHGMSNLVDDLPVGSAFSIHELPANDRPPTDADFLRQGTEQVCAGIALYGPRTMLVVTTGAGVDGFTLDRDVGNFVLTHPQLRIPAEADVFSINAADAPHWPAPVKRYVEECVLGADGPRGRDFKMRWNASALVGAFRVLNNGGLFLVPDTGRPSGWLAPLLYNAAPLAFLAEQAGGAATTGSQRVLTVVPTALDHRVPFFFGSAPEVARLERYVTEHEQGDDHEFVHPLFHNRTLFAD